MYRNTITSEYITGPWNSPDAASLGLVDILPLSDERSFAEEFMEEASQYLANIALLNTAFLDFMADGTKELSTTPDAACFQDPLYPTQGNADDKSFEGTVKEATIAVYEDGRCRYKCDHCGKLHDRKSRAEDCRNVDLGIKPYRCLGKCGKISCVQSYASEALLRRHYGPCHLRYAECAQCHLQLYKQNLARHLRTCKGSPS